MSQNRSPTPLPSFLMGLGFGGFVDGIVLHEILQWHHMISGTEPTDTVAGLELNVIADGFFHVATCRKKSRRASSSMFNRSWATSASSG